MTPRTLLFLLAFANFVVGMGAFVVVGVLSPLADAFGIDKGTAGWVLTAYALVYAVASPVLVALSGALDRRTVLAAGFALFLAGAAGAALAPSFALLLVARAVMAVGAGLITPVAASIGVALVEPQARGRALATVFGGLTLSQVLGVPVGAWAGYAYGWHAAFFGVVGLSVLALAAVLWAVPRGLKVPLTSLATLGAVLVRPRLVAAVGFTVLFIAGLYNLYTYLGPFLEGRLGLGRDGITAMLALFGLGAVLGNVMGGMLTDRIGPGRTLVGLCTAQIVLMPVLTLVPLGLVATAALVAGWSLCAWSFMVPQQARLAALDPASTPVLFALNAAAIYIGGSLGALSGGAILAAQGIAPLGLGGAVLVTLALASLWLVARLRPA